MVYQLILSFMDNIGWYITQCCLSWTILVGIFTGFVCQGNNGWCISRFCLLLTIWLVFNTVLSVVDKLVGISTGIVCQGQYWFVYLPVVFVMNYNGWYITQFCLSWTILARISHSIVSHLQYWLVYQPFFFLPCTVMFGLSSGLSVMDCNGLFIAKICMQWTKFVGISSIFVCHGQ